MKTTVDIPQKELEELMKNTKTTLKREAIVTAIVDFNRRKRLQKLGRLFGTFKKLISLDELQRQRKDG